MSEPRCFDDGCNGCDDEPREPPEYGCCLGDECCMPGMHFPSECHTAADYERTHGAGWSGLLPARNVEDMK